MHATLKVPYSLPSEPSNHNKRREPYPQKKPCTNSLTIVQPTLTPRFDTGASTWSSLSIETHPNSRFPSHEAKRKEIYSSPTINSTMAYTGISVPFTQLQPSFDTSCHPHLRPKSAHDITTHVKPPHSWTRSFHLSILSPQPRSRKATLKPMISSTTL